MPHSADRSSYYLLGKYKIQDRIGTGGMAEVYRGFHEKLNRTVAVKILHPSLTNDPKFTARFEREARLAANLRHPGIVQVYDFDMQGDLYFLIMEYINGGSLKKHLEDLSSLNEFMPLKEVSRAVRQIANALDYAHDQGMLHRDLKPANILIDDSGNTYLSDFGIARLVDSSEITRSGSILGTPAYMSPEQCEGKSLTPASDLYSLGIVIFEMISGHVPFNAESSLAILQMHIHEEIPTLEGTRTGLPSGLDQFLKKALAKKPEDRFQSALEMARVFATLVPDFSDTIQADTRTGVVDKPSAGKNRQSALESGKNRPTGWLVAIGIIAVLLISAVVMVWIARQSNLAAARQCTTVDSCETAAVGFARENKPVLAIETYLKAISLVPSIEQTAHAKLKCDLADLYVKTEKPVEARKAYRECIAWTHDVEDQSALRDYAQKKLKNLK
ncbi:MAG: serine/threonine protein kinase [Leptolinea sp.]|jgi:serine/threonine protein kinase|nr:serine/threonine protein kinase [Leptolinea sp.]